MIRSYEVSSRVRDGSRINSELKKHNSTSDCKFWTGISSQNRNNFFFNNLFSIVNNNKKDAAAKEDGVEKLVSFLLDLIQLCLSRNIQGLFSTTVQTHIQENTAYDNNHENTS